MTTVVGLALSGFTAQAQLITGDSDGSFSNDQGPGTRVTYYNPPAGVFNTSAVFFTGTKEVWDNTTANTGVTFTGSLFSPLQFNLVPGGSTGPLGIGYFIYSNANTVANTTAYTVDFALTLDFGVDGTINVSPFTITLDGGDPLAPGFVDNQFSIVDGASGSILVDGLLYDYSFSFDSDAIIVPEAGFGIDSSATNNLYITFTNSEGLIPIPEPSTYALAGVVLLGGIVALRRRSRGHAVVTSALAA